LEYLSELGILGSLLLFSAVFSMLFVAFRTWRKRRHPEVRGLALGGFLSVLAILLHSLTDFNMHIPANLLLFSVVLSLTVAIVFYKGRGHGRPGGRVQNGSPPGEEGGPA
jgi:O-antigen ligase